MGVKDNKKVFIIQLMDGKSDAEILSERAKIIRKLTEAGYDTVDSYIKDDVPKGCVHGGVYYLGRSIEMLSWADYIYLCEDWDIGRGCIIEREVAQLYGIPEVIL